MPSRRPGTPADRRGAGRRLVRAAAVLLLAAAACAKEEPPPGAEPDQTPPAVREIVPADGAVVPDLDGPLKIRYDEPIEPPRGLARRLVASPLAEYRVEFGFDEIRVRPAEGWLSGAVYRIRLPGGVSDLLRNRREDTLQVTFSTGPAIPETRVSGRIVNRVDRQPQRGAVALFLPIDGDSIPYGAVADTGGRFELAALPPGAYRAYGFRDLNANRSVERRLEPWDSTTFRLEGPSATAELRLSVLEPDTTPPRLALAEALDSVSASLTFDDHLDPTQPLRPASVTVTAAGGDTVPVAAVSITRAGAGLAPADTAADAVADTTPAALEGAGGDTDAARPAVSDTALRLPELRWEELLVVPPPGRGIPDGLLPAPESARGDTLPLPSRTLFLRTARPFRDSVRYRVAARGLRNLQGLTGGGDTTFVYVAPEAPARDTVGGAPGPSGAEGPELRLPWEGLVPLPWQQPVPEPPVDAPPTGEAAAPADTAAPAAPNTARGGGRP